MTSLRGRRTLLLALGAALAALAGCVPAVPASPAVAVLNAPAGARISGSAEALERALADQGPLDFSFLPDGVMRFQEGHNDFSRHRSVGSAARVARSFGAPVAVTIGARVLDRRVTLSDDGSARRVDVSLQLEAVVIDARTAQVRRDVVSRVLDGTRRESTAAPLPAEADDPTVHALRDLAVTDLAPAVLHALWESLGTLNLSGSSGG